MGFQFVASGPLVRSSYHAAEAFVAAAIAPPTHTDEARPDVQSRGVGEGQLLRPESLNGSPKLTATLADIATRCLA